MTQPDNVVGSGGPVIGSSEIKKPEDGPLRAEIQFFMDKIFQASLAYFVLLVSALALSKTSITGDVAVAAHMRTGDVVACTLLLLNVLYATLSGSCLFAVLKRGLFALITRERVSETWRKWEIFVRDDSHARGNINMRLIAWNIDNYYVVPIFLGVVAVSTVSAVYCIAGGTVAARWAGIALVAAHVMPIMILIQLGKLNAICRRIARQP